MANKGIGPLEQALFGPRLKGFPHRQQGLTAAEIGEQGWNVLDGRMPLPLAILKRTALEHNIGWMQKFVAERGIDLAPHGKTTMSPQLFARQLEAGAWGMTFANVAQLAIGVAAGVRRALIANQVFADDDLGGIQALRADHEDLRVVFLMDSLAQLALVEAWFARNPASGPFEAMIEIGIRDARTGCRTEEQAVALARAMSASAAVRLVGIECYEGLGAAGNSARDEPFAKALMDRVEAIARICDRERLFEEGEVILSAGGSAIFDLVAERLKPALGRPVRGLLRSGCYVTHDHGQYGRMANAMRQRCGFAETLQPALEVWTHVQSRPEPGLAILSVGRRDISFDIEMPIPFARAPIGSLVPASVPPSWKITGLNDQHAYLRWESHHEDVAPPVGERIGLGISHPCTTFDKWHWMPVVEDDYRITDAIAIHF